MIEYTNYYHKKLELHKQMINDIKELMNENNLKIIYFRKYPPEIAGSPTVVFIDSEGMPREQEITAVNLDKGKITINTVDDYGFSGYAGLDIDDEVLPTSIDTLYDSVFSVVNYIKNKQ